MRSLIAVSTFAFLCLSSLLYADPADLKVTPPRILRFSMSIGRAEIPGPSRVTFAIYREQNGGTPLWSETQTLEIDEQGHLTVLLGATNEEGIPLDIFSSGEGRWLAVQREGAEEGARILLASVPYALKAGDAETLGGKPPSAFVLADESEVDRQRSRTVPTPLMIPYATSRPIPSTTALRPAGNAVATYGFFLGSTLGATSIGFATEGGEWKVYLKPSSAEGFDTSDLRMTLRNSGLLVTNTAQPAGFAIRGETTQQNGSGVAGVSTATTGLGIGVYADGGNTTALNYGLLATGGEYGLWAEPSGTSGNVYGGYFNGLANTAVNYGLFATGEEFGVRAESSTGVAISGRSTSGDLITLYGSNTLDTEFRVSNTGDVTADGTFSTPAADVAERVAADDSLEAGDVVEIDPEHMNRFRLSRSARSTLVAGVISTEPGVLLNDRTAHGGDADQRPMLALAGQIPVKVTATNGPIRPGDLLVSSSVPGRAMRAGRNARPGTILGKALEPLQSGTGTIRMLVLMR